MGLLDDAIREHLDLKRRRGGDPTEIERAEREALGPVRRGPELTGEDVAAEPAGVPAAEHPAEPAEEWEPFQEDPEPQAVEEPEELMPYEHPRAPDGDPLMDDEPFSGEAHRAVPSEPADFEPDPEPPPAPHPADPAPAHSDEPSTRVDQETEEYELEPEEGEESGDDVLESTPEFLQDAPEHDRLWFEQRPPRDFDFDG